MGRWKRELNSTSAFTVQAYFDRTNRRDINFAEVRNTFDIDFVHHMSGRRYDLNWGAGVRSSPADFTQVVPTVDSIPHQQTYNLFSAFFENQFTLVPGRLFFTAGTKLEHNSFSGFEVQPSGRLLWTPSKRQSVWGGGTWAVRTPSRGWKMGSGSVLFWYRSAPYVRLVGDWEGLRRNKCWATSWVIGHCWGPRVLRLRCWRSTIEYDDLLSVGKTAPTFVESNPGPPASGSSAAVAYSD